MSFLSARRFALIGFTLLLANCASGFNSNLEDAIFELNKGNYSNAISKATSALQKDPGNVRASRILANAYFGRSGIDFLALASVVLDLQDSTDSNFRVIANALPESADLDDLRSAIETLEALNSVDDADVTGNSELADAVYDLAIMQAIEHFAIGVYQSDYFGDALDVTGITDDGAANALDDMVDFDNRLLASGIEDDEDFIGEIRQSYCILEPLSGDPGFTASEYRVLVACQLSDSPSTFNTVAIDAAIPNCDTVSPDNQSAEVQACYDSNTVLE